MKTRQVITVLVTSVALGGITGAAAVSLNASGDPVAPTKSAAAPEPTAPATSAANLIVKPGSVGPVVGMMSLSEGVETGYLLESAGPPPPNTGCWAPRLKWKNEFGPGLDLRTNGEGDITEIIVKTTATRTSNGLGVGSTYSEIRDKGSSLGNVSDVELNSGVDVVKDGSSVFIYNAANSGYIGFMFAESPENLTADSKAIQVEVSKGSQPLLDRVGC